MGVCTCNQNKEIFNKLDNLILNDLGKNNIQISKTKQLTSPSTIMTNGFRLNTNNILNKKTLNESEREVKSNPPLIKYKSENLILNRSIFLPYTIIKKNFEKTLFIYGDKESGKTSLLIKICAQKFNIFYIPSLSDEKNIKLLRLKPYSKRFKLELNVTNNINEIKEADCYIILFDVTSLNSWNFAKNLIESKIISKQKPVILIVNKIDIGNKINIHYLQEFLLKYKCDFFYISLKESNGISLLFEKLGEILDYKEEIEIKD